MFRLFLIAVFKDHWYKRIYMYVYNIIYSYIIKGLRPIYMCVCVCVCVCGENI